MNITLLSTKLFTIKSVKDQELSLGQILQLPKTVMQRQSYFKQIWK